MRSRASEPIPKTTVAQEMVQEFAMPSRQGLEGMSQDTTGILPPTVYNRDMPSSMMASGGSTNPQGYFFGGSVTATGPSEPVYDEDGNLLEGIEALKASGKLRRFLKALMKEGGLTGYADRGKTEFTPTYVVPGGYYANPKFIDAVDRGEIFIGGPNEFKYMKPERAGDTAYNYLMDTKGEPKRVIRKPFKENFDSAGDAILEGLKEAGNIMFNPFPNEFRKNITDTKQLEALVEGREEKKKERREMIAEDREDYSRKMEQFIDAKNEARANRLGMSEEMKNQFRKEYKAIIENSRAKNLPPEFTTLQLEGLQRKYERLAPFQEIRNLAGIIGITPKFNPFVEDGKRIKGKDMIKRVEGKQEGGLTGYQTGNQTALAGSFIYGGNYADNLEDFLDMKRKTSTMDRREQSYLGQDDLKFPMLSTTPDFSMDMSGIGALAFDQKDLNENVQSTLPFMPFGEPDRVVNAQSIANQQKRVDEAQEFLNKQLKIGDRGGLGGGSSYIDQARRRLATAKARLNAMLNRQDLDVQIAETEEKVNEPVKKQIAEFSDLLDGKIKIETDDGSKDGTTDTSTSKKFADMDLNIPERTQKPRTEAQMKQQLNADVLMTLGTAIGSSATPAEIFQKLSGLPAQLAASRKEQRKEVRDFESDRRADALQKLNIQIALKKIDQAQEQAKLKGDANDIAAINAIADVLTNITDTSSPRYKAAENALDSIIAKLTGSNAQGIAALEKQFENIATLGG